MADNQELLSGWDDDAREIAELVIEKYGEPDEATRSMLVWQGNGPWKRTVVYRDLVAHDFPKPHKDGVEQTIDYEVPPRRFSDLARFDGSVIAERTRGELSARCHDEEANFLALNLSHDIVTGERSVEEARDFYAQAMLDFRAGEEVPYMDSLQFEPQGDAADPDVRTLSDEQLREAAET